MMIVFLCGDNAAKNTPSFVALIDSLPGQYHFVERRDYSLSSTG
jgi:hypothetical protein